MSSVSPLRPPRRADEQLGVPPHLRRAQRRVDVQELAEGSHPLLALDASPEVELELLGPLARRLLQVEPPNIDFEEELLLERHMVQQQLLALDRNGIPGSNPAGFRAWGSFSGLKSALGSAGPGNHWHHIIEQTPGNVERFGPHAIHNADNVIPLEEGLHTRVSGFYSSIQIEQVLKGLWGVRK